jgi:hypothetical protein
MVTRFPSGSTAWTTPTISISCIGLGGFGGGVAGLGGGEPEGN